MSDADSETDIALELPPRPSLAARLFTVAVAGATTLVPFGLLLQFILKDRVAFLAPLFYALPLPLLAAVSLAGAAGLLLKRRRRLAAGAFGVCLAVGIIWICRSWNAAPQPGRDGSIRTAFWNTMHNHYPTADYAADLCTYDADIIGLVEAPAELTAWQRLFPDHRVDGSGSMKLLVRGEILQRRANHIPKELKLQHWTIRVRGARLEVFLVDMDANPFYNRKRALTMLYDQITRAGDAPVIVMGDFNTPLESVHYADLRQDLTPAEPNGFRETWPFGLPVLSLDQVWLGNGATALGCAKQSRRRSDHAALFVDVQITRQEEGENHD